MIKKIFLEIKFCKFSRSKTNFTKMYSNFSIMKKIVLDIAKDIYTKVKDKELM